ncbi:MAG: hypothetical protein AAGF25_10235 [Pseudomonadota bacterium]
MKSFMKLFLILVSIMCALPLFNGVGIGFIGIAIAADPIPPDYAKAPDWWPRGVRYSNPPQKKKPKGWVGDWPPEKKMGHDPAFWTKYYRLKPRAPKEFGKPGNPDQATGTGYTGNRRFTERIPTVARLNSCGVARFTGRSQRLVGGSCDFVTDPISATADLCKRVIQDPRAERHCRRVCATKINSAGSRGCSSTLIKPPAFVNWTCADKEAGVLVTCAVTHLCQCSDP